MIVCFAAVLSVSAFAVNIDDYAFVADDGSMQYDMDAYHYAVAQEMVLDSGIDIDPSLYFLRDPVTGDFCGYDFNSFLNDYDFAVAAMNPPVVSENVEPLEPATPPLEVETEIEVETDSAVLPVILEDDEVLAVQEVEVIEPHQYVVEDLRSPPVDPSTLYIDYNSCDYPYWEQNDSFYFISSICPPVELLESAFFTICLEDEDIVIPGSEFTFIDDSFVIAGTFWFLYEPFEFLGLWFPPGFYCASDIGYLADNDSLPECLFITIPDYDFGGASMSGTLKSLVVSIFGEYTPVNTTALLMETVDNETTTTLVDVVASGMAGVDWEWCAGVFLFGIMLYCLFKLLGGILS